MERTCKDNVREVLRPGSEEAYNTLFLETCRRKRGLQTFEKGFKAVSYTHLDVYKRPLPKKDISDVSIILACFADKNNQLSRPYSRTGLTIEL